MHDNPIIVVDDDLDDLELIESVIKDIGIQNKLHFFRSGNELIDHLQNSEISPFIVLCDVNMPREDGIEIRRRLEINEETHYKSVPFIFWSTSASEQQIRKAYDMHSQGFFIKADSYEKLKATMITILDYWTLSQHPKPL